MTIEKPKTLTGFKKRAKKMQKLSGAKHMACLEELARQCGWANYNQARRDLEGAKPQ